MKKTALIAAAAVLAATSAQAFWGDRVINDYIATNYEPLSVSSFAGSGGATSIYGTTRDQASAEEIAAAIRLPAHFSPRDVSAGPQGERRGPHLVLVIEPQGVTPKRACEGKAKGGVAGSELRVLGVFCSSFGTPVSEAMLVADGSPVPGDGDFSDTMLQLRRVMVPVRNPDRDGPQLRIGG
ncbi:MAG: hypothetical protein AAFU55_02585 [Pseudomonadota bacterium]